MGILYIIFSLVLFILITIYIKYNKKEGFDNNLNMCFYTCFYGSDNNEAFNIPPLPSSKYKCFYFTNNKLLLEKIKKTKWIGIYDKYLIQEDYALLMREHNFIKNNVLDEFNESMKQKRYVEQKDQYLTYINNQIKNGLSKSTEKHAMCNVLIRNMKHSKIKDINNTWYSHIQECGIQDQISFFFVKQLYKDYIYIYSESPCKNTNSDWRCNT
jgi:hypothetical protein